MKASPNRPPQFETKLNFAHITKTGGTSIEDCARENGIMWGRFFKGLFWWHDIPNNYDESIKYKYDWFSVVRNPFTRIVSEFNYYNESNVSEFLSFGCIFKKEDFNKVLCEQIEGKIKWFSKYKRGHHWIPQSEYFKNDINIKVIKFENLRQELESLTKEYNLSIRLDKFSNKSKDRKYKKAKLFSVKDLSDKSIETIVSVYGEDFEMFDYNKEI
jgi:hypothetical protein